MNMFVTNTFVSDRATREHVRHEHVPQRFASLPNMFVTNAFGAELQAGRGTVLRAIAIDEECQLETLHEGEAL
ncbi:hypothetical protein [Paractinoplanes atraurantiacus]|uniref:hypothetical protein n=1 Tax=Paractinoplanes atraurantiacus TaxID=1036182 RepID=UPI001177B917|nr:hypothetical protein [Actinoplanes atraurantiacus]